MEGATIPGVQVTDPGPSFLDQWSATSIAIQNGTFDPVGSNYTGAFFGQPGIAPQGKNSGAAPLSTAINSPLTATPPGNLQLGGSAPTQPQYVPAPAGSFASSWFVRIIVGVLGLVMVAIGLRMLANDQRPLLVNPFKGSAA